MQISNNPDVSLAEIPEDHCGITFLNLTGDKPAPVASVEDNKEE